MQNPISKGLGERKFYSAAVESKYNSICGENKPILVGGIGEINYGKQYRQGNRIYHSNNIAMACLSHPIGNIGGNSYLYLIDDTYKSRQPRVYKEKSPSIRSRRHGFKVVYNERK